MTDRPISAGLHPFSRRNPADGMPASLGPLFETAVETWNWSNRMFRGWEQYRKPQQGERAAERAEQNELGRRLDNAVELAGRTQLLGRIPAGEFKACIGRLEKACYRLRYANVLWRKETGCYGPPEDDPAARGYWVGDDSPITGGTSGEEELAARWYERLRADIWEVMDELDRIGRDLAEPPEQGGTSTTADSEPLGLEAGPEAVVNQPLKSDKPEKTVGQQRKILTDDADVIWAANNLFNGKRMNKRDGARNYLKSKDSQRWNRLDQEQQDKEADGLLRKTRRHLKK